MEDGMARFSQVSAETHRFVLISPVITSNLRERRRQVTGIIKVTLISKFYVGL